MIRIENQGQREAIHSNANDPRPPSVPLHGDLPDVHVPRKDVAKYSGLKIIHSDERDPNNSKLRST